MKNVNAVFPSNGTRQSPKSSSASLAILLPHDNAKHTGPNWVPWMERHITTIGNIEKLTGINFLPGVSGSKRSEMENFKAAHIWEKN